MKVCCVLLLEAPHRGDSNEYTQYTIFNIKKKITQNYPKSAAIGVRSKGLTNEFETAVVNEPSVFEPLKFYCIQPLLQCDALQCKEISLSYFSCNWVPISSLYCKGIPLNCLSKIILKRNREAIQLPPPPPPFNKILPLPYLYESRERIK